MPRSRTALTATLLVGSVLGGSAIAVAPALAADDDLTYAQAKKARTAALKQLSGRVVSIDRDGDDGRSVYEVVVITKGNRARQVDLDSRFRVLRTTREGRDGLTYTSAGRAANAALARVKGILVDIEYDDDRTRYEVKILTASSVQREVRLTSAFRPR